MSGTAGRPGVARREQNDRLLRAELLRTIYFEHLISLARPAGSPDRSALPIAGDDEAAKKSVTALLDRLGYDTVDAGTTNES
ncbi:hypothetical protein [Streptomyces sp. 2A115]|uniref:hypothetical protein n=1 Tax=Streptomyces sp. 2A115 TaxID=3457439 RepID=UPI003FD07D79